MFDNQQKVGEKKKNSFLFGCELADKCPIRFHNVEILKNETRESGYFNSVNGISEMRELLLICVYVLSSVDIIDNGGDRVIRRMQLLSFFVIFGCMLQHFLSSVKLKDKLEREEDIYKFFERV